MSLIPKRLVKIPKKKHDRTCLYTDLEGETLFMQKFTSLGKRIGLQNAAFYSLFLLVITSIITVLVQRDMVQNEKDRLLYLTQNVSQEIVLVLNKGMQTARAVASTLSAAKEPNSVIDRRQTWSMGKQALFRDSQFMGIVLAFEPDIIEKDNSKANTIYHDQTGRFMNVLTKKENGDVAIEVIKGYEKEETAPWYFIPKNTLKEYITEPLVYTFQGKEIPIVGFASPILYKNKFIGVVGMNYTLDFVQDFINQKRNIFGGKYNLSVVSAQGQYVAFKGNKEKILTSLKDELDDATYQKRLDQLKTGKEYIEQDKKQFHVYVPFKVGHSETFWQVHLSIANSTLTQKPRQLVFLLFALLIIFGGAFLLLTVLLITKQLKPLTEVATSAQAISNGDLSNSIAVLKRKDEIGILSNSFFTMQETLKNMVGQIRLNTEQIVDTGKFFISTASQVSQGSNNQAASLEEISAVMEETSSRVKYSAQMAKEVEKEIKTSQIQISRVEQATQESLQSIHQIEEKIRSVTAIASQTNVLALNTGIEAARAGLHGKGFAVVASEVRKLAERSKQIADEVSNLNTVSLATNEKNEQELKIMIQNIEKYTLSMQKLVQISEEQAEDVSQVKNTMQEINQVTQGNASSAGDLTTTVDKLNSQAQSLLEIIFFSRFRFDKIFI